MRLQHLVRQAWRLGALFAWLCGCGTATHISNYVPKQRDYAVPAASEATTTSSSPGSLWRAGHPASMLFTDARALRENDLVVVKVEEIADAKRSADTDTSRESKSAAALAMFMKSAGTVYSAGNPNLAIDGSSSSQFKGEGSTARTERLTATVPAIVRKVLPNGNLFIEGHRVVLVNSEEQHFYISGVVRPIDIDQENSVKSSMIADAEIEFTGRGILTDNQRQGWLSKMLGGIWPF